MLITQCLCMRSDCILLLCISVHIYIYPDTVIHSMFQFRLINWMEGVKESSVYFLIHILYLHIRWLLTFISQTAYMQLVCLCVRITIGTESQLSLIWSVSETYKNARAHTHTNTYASAYWLVGYIEMHFQLSSIVWKMNDNEIVHFIPHKNTAQYQRKSRI